MIKTINGIACLIFTLLKSSCKDAGCNTVLNSAINETLPLEKSLELTLANSWTYANGGGCGLIIYGKGNNVVAYGRCSTMSESSNSKVQGRRATNSRSINWS